MLLLIDSRAGSDPEPEPKAIAVDWRLASWLLLCLVLLVGAALAPAVPGTVLGFVGLLATGKVLLVANAGSGLSGAGAGDEA